MSLVTNADWKAEVEAMFRYLEIERGLTFEEATSLIRLLFMGDKQPVSQS